MYSNTNLRNLFKFCKLGFTIPFHAQIVPQERQMYILIHLLYSKVHLLAVNYSKNRLATWFPLQFFRFGINFNLLWDSIVNLIFTIYLWFHFFAAVKNIFLQHFLTARTICTSDSPWRLKCHFLFVLKGSWIPSQRLYLKLACNQVSKIKLFFYFFNINKISKVQ